MAIQYRRTDCGESEILTICKLGKARYCQALDRHTAYCVQITTGTGPDDDFVGLYDLDGDQIDHGHGTKWHPCSEAPVDVLSVFVTRI